MARFMLSSVTHSGPLSLSSHIFLHCTNPPGYNKATDCAYTHCMHRYIHTHIRARNARRINTHATLATHSSIQDTDRHTVHSWEANYWHCGGADYAVQERHGSPNARRLVAAGRPRCCALPTSTPAADAAQPFLFPTHSDEILPAGFPLDFVVCPKFRSRESP